MTTSIGEQDDLHDRMLPFIFDLPSSALCMVDNLATLPRLKDALAETCLLGIDTETQPAFKKRKWNHFQTHPTAIIQIATRSKRGAEQVFIVDMLVCIVDHVFKAALDEILLKAFINKNVMKIGQGLERDFDELHLSYPSMRCFEVVEGIVETHDMVKQLEPEVIQMISLKALVKTYLHHELLKTQQCSNWGKRPLTAGQIQYAACDALVLLRLYDAMLCEIEDLYIERDEEFDILSIAKTADLTIPKEMTTSARKRKSTFFETREQWRVKSQSNETTVTTKIEMESNDGTSADSVSDEELTKFGKRIPWSSKKQKKLCETLLEPLIQRKHTHFTDS